jgi:hypothetical protein
MRAETAIGIGPVLRELPRKKKTSAKLGRFRDKKKTGA